MKMTHPGLYFDERIEDSVVAHKLNPVGTTTETTSRTATTLEDEESLRNDTDQMSCLSGWITFQQDDTSVVSLLSATNLTPEVVKKKKTKKKSKKKKNLKTDRIQQKVQERPSDETSPFRCERPKKALSAVQEAAEEEDDDQDDDQEDTILSSRHVGNRPTMDSSISSNDLSFSQRGYYSDSSSVSAPCHPSMMTLSSPSSQVDSYPPKPQRKRSLSPLPPPPPPPTTTSESPPESLPVPTSPTKIPPSSWTEITDAIILPPFQRPVSLPFKRTSPSSSNTSIIETKAVVAPKKKKSVVETPSPSHEMAKPATANKSVTPASSSAPLVQDQQESPKETHSDVEYHSTRLLNQVDPYQEEEEEVEFLLMNIIDHPGLADIVEPAPQDNSSVVLTTATIPKPRRFQMFRNKVKGLQTMFRRKRKPNPSNEQGIHGPESSSRVSMVRRVASLSIRKRSNNIVVAKKKSFTKKNTKDTTRSLQQNSLVRRATSFTVFGPRDVKKQNNPYEDPFQWDSIRSSATTAVDHEKSGEIASEQPPSTSPFRRSASWDPRNLTSPTAANVEKAQPIRSPKRKKSTSTSTKPGSKPLKKASSLDPRALETILRSSEVHALFHDAASLEKAQPILSPKRKKSTSTGTKHGSKPLKKASSLDPRALETILRSSEDHALVHDAASLEKAQPLLSPKRKKSTSTSTKHGSKPLKKASSLDPRALETILRSSDVHALFPDAASLEKTPPILSPKRKKSTTKHDKPLKKASSLDPRALENVRRSSHDHALSPFSTPKIKKKLSKKKKTQKLKRALSLNECPFEERHRNDIEFTPSSPTTSASRQLTRAASLNQLALDSKPKDEMPMIPNRTTFRNLEDMTMILPPPPIHNHGTPPGPKRKSSTRSPSKKHVLPSPNSSSSGGTRSTRTRTRKQLQKGSAIKRLPFEIEMDQESQIDSDFDESEKDDIVSPLVSLRSGKRRVSMSPTTMAAPFVVDMDAVKRITIAELERGYTLAQMQNDPIAEKIHRTQLLLLGK